MIRCPPGGLQLTAGGRLPQHFHSRFQNSSIHRAFDNGPKVDLNPADARKYKIHQGDRVAVESSYGKIILNANLTHAVEEGAAFIYQDYPDADVNSIIGPDHLDPISGFPGYRSVCCRVYKVKAEEAAV